MIANPDSPDSRRKWQHWLNTFSNYVDDIENINNENKSSVLIDLINSSIYEYINEATTFHNAITILRNTYANKVFARHRLATCEQKLDHS